MDRYYLLPIEYKNLLIEYKVLHLVEYSKKHNGYYVSEQIYLTFQNDNKL